MNPLSALRKSWLIRALAWTVALAAAGAVLMLYTRPDFLRLVADQVWACF